MQRWTQKKNRKCMDLTEAEDIKRGGKNKQKNYTKNVNDQDNQDCMITYLKPDILECKVN